MLRVNFFICLWAILFTQTPGAFACSYGSEWTEQKEFTKAKEVFRGTVIKTQLSEIIDRRENKKIFAEVYYELKEVLKGTPDKDRPALTLIYYMGGCGLPMLVGLDYLFYIQDFSDTSPDEMKKSASGMISMFTKGLHPNEKFAEEEMKKARDYKTLQ